jgi:OmpA-OmpF porin, OOP family
VANLQLLNKALKSCCVTAAFLLLCCSVAVAQNLVSNWSFEDTIVCPLSTGQISYAKYWFSPTTASTDYFNSCGSTFVSTPSNQVGYQKPKTGIAYSGIVPYYYSNYREYLSSKLSSKLKGKNYCISFYVSISIDSVYYSIISPLPVVSQIENPSSRILKDSIGWELVSGVFQAKGGEEYIIIGNFKNNSETTVEQLKDTTFGPFSYYYIDDVSVIEVPQELFTAGGADKARCANDEAVTLGSPPVGGWQYLWSTGATTAQIEVRAPRQMQATT